MSPLQTVVVVNYAALALAGVLLCRAHLLTARRANAAGLLFVALVLGIEAMEHMLLLGANALSVPAAVTATPTSVYGLVLAARALSWVRLGLGWGLLLGARYALLPLAQVTTVADAARLVWQGYTGAARGRVRYVRVVLAPRRRPSPFNPTKPLPDMALSAASAAEATTRDLLSSHLDTPTDVTREEIERRLKTLVEDVVPRVFAWIGRKVVRALMRALDSRANSDGDTDRP